LTLKGFRIRRRRCTDPPANPNSHAGIAFRMKEPPHPYSGRSVRVRNCVWSTPPAKEGPTTPRLRCRILRRLQVTTVRACRPAPASFLRANTVSRPEGQPPAPAFVEYRVCYNESRFGVILESHLKPLVGAPVQQLSASR
jgi:hypothetical protein